MKKEQIPFYLAIFVIIGWSAAICHYAYTMIFPTKVIDYHFTQAQVMNQDKRVKRGEFLEFEFLYSKYVDCQGIISRSLVNDRIVHLTEEKGATPPGLNQRKMISVYIPTNIFPGRYRMVTNVRFPVRSNRDISTKYETEWFEVVE